MVRLLIGFGVYIFGLFFVAKAQKRSIGIDDYFAIKSMGSPQVSPDGQWVAYTVTSTDLEKDKRETRIWMTDLNGKEHLPMTAEGYSAANPRWSPDGKYLSFTASKGEGKTQVWGLNRKGGEAQQLTRVKQGVSGYAWSPNGERLLLLIKDPKPKTAQSEPAKKEKPEPFVIDRLQFKRDYAGYLDNRRTHLYVQAVGDTSLTQITSGDFDDSQPAWSPDGQSVAFVSNRSANPDGNSNNDIWIVAADNPDKGKTLLQLTSNPGSDYAPTWSPDGKSIAYVTVTEPEIIWYAGNYLAVHEVGKKEPLYLTQNLDRNVSRPRYSPDGKAIFFILEDSGERALAKIDLASRKISRPIGGNRSVRFFHQNGMGQTVALISEPHVPPAVFSLDASGLKALSNENDEILGELNLAEVRNIHFNSKDGTEIEGFLFLPPGYDAKFKYPTLLRIHGGPVSQYDFSFNYEAQLFAAHGYVVVITNPRGSSGYGQEFSKAIWADWGNKDFEDVMAGIDFVIAEGIADPNRLGVGGWSYGGILTNYVITKTDRFKGAISGASEVLYRSNYGHDHYQSQWEAELGLPWQNAESWERISPFNDVEKIVTPTLVMGGAIDWNVPILNSEQLYQALKRLGRTTQLIVYPGEHHGIRRPSFQKDRYERYLNWYDRFVKSE